MKKFPLILSLSALTIISACKEERKNPLLEKPTVEVVNWVLKNTNSDIENCAKSWADPKTALKSNLKRCAPIAKNLTEEMNYVGFSQKLIVDDLNVPIIWREFNRRVVKREEFLLKTKKSREKTKQNTKGYHLLK